MRRATALSLRRGDCHMRGRVCEEPAPGSRIRAAGGEPPVAGTPDLSGGWRRGSRWAAPGRGAAAYVGRRGCGRRLLAVRLLAEPSALARVAAACRGAHEERERKECRQGLFHAEILLGGAAPIL